MKVFGSSGVRGVTNDSLTPEFLVRVAMAAGSTLRADGADRVALGRDSRRTGGMFADAAAAGLASVGCDVDRLGVLPTPALQSYAASEGVPAVMVTASHNPPEYNGIKLIAGDGIELRREALERVEDRLLADRFDRADWADTGTSRTVDGVQRSYVEAAVAAADRERIADAELTVAVDPGHGAGSLTSPALFRELGCEVVTVNAEADGSFPGRDPEPVEGNLADLRRLVRAAGADVGVAHDGDADRAVFVDEQGRHIEGDAALAALAAAELQRGDVAVSAVNVSQRLVDVVNDVGASLELTPIGSTNIITRVRELQAEGQRVPVAGEGNGGVLFPDYRLARDGGFTAARFCELLAEHAASTLVDRYDGYANVRTNVRYDDDTERERLLAAAEAAAREESERDAELTTIDGYRLDYGDAWVLVRPSGTEPLIRVYSEARSRERAAELAAFAEDALADA
jgi:phosphomannomutase/phosphoglucomutase